MGMQIQLAAQRKSAQCIHLLKRRNEEEESLRGGFNFLSVSGGAETRMRSVKLKRKKHLGCIL